MLYSALPLASEEEEEEEEGLLLLKTLIMPL
jgi:hypothetical protein